MQLTTAKPDNLKEATTRFAWLSTYGATLFVISLTVLAFLMRRKGLATQSLWFDEADLVARANRDLGAILADFVRVGENGQLYTLLMHFWLKIAGTGEAAVRTPSLLAGTAVVPMIYLLGRRFLGGVWVGIIAAALVTVSPYLLWYSQDGKMYPLTLFMTVASTYIFLHALEKKKIGWWLAYAALTVAAFYVHVTTGFIGAVHLVYYLVGYRRLNRTESTPEETAKRRKRLLIIGVAVAALCTPVALWQIRALWDGTIGKTWFAPVGLPEMVNTLGRRFGVNRIPDLLWEGIGALFYALLVALGIFAVWKAQKSAIINSGEKSSIKHSPALLLTIYLALPILGFYLLTMRIPLFADRYLLLASPAYYLLAAWGLVWLGKKFAPAALVAGVVAVGFAVVALFSFNYSDAPQKEDWREAMRWLKTEVRPGDEILVLPGYTKTAVDYYFQSGEVPVYGVPQEILDGKDVRALNNYLFGETGIFRDKERVWLVVSPERYAQDEPTQFLLKTWFNYNSWMFSHPKVFVGAAVYGFTFKQIPGTNKDYFSPSTARQVEVFFGDNMLLEGYELVPSADQKRKPGVVRYDEKLHLTLYWRRWWEDKTNYEVRVRLLDAAGNDTGTNYSAPPLNGYYPTSQWKYREAVRDYREIYVRVPPGKYKLEVSLYPAGQPSALLPVRGTYQGQAVSGQSVLVLPLEVTVEAGS
jgi:mannosyltransferase